MVDLPSNIALAQIFIAGCLFDKQLDLALNGKCFFFVSEIPTGKFLSDPCHNRQSLFVQSLRLIWIFCKKSRFTSEIRIRNTRKFTNLNV